ncbi:unnamed protein product [Closterium sp. NIES-54]
MASLRVLTFDHEGRPIQFDTWLDDLQLYILSDYRDIVSLFDHTSGASLDPSATADSATRSQWLTRDAAARLAIRNYLLRPCTPLRLTQVLPADSFATVGDASVFLVWCSRAFVRDTSVDKLSSRAIPCVFLGFPVDAPGWPFYHPISRRVLPSQDVTFDGSVPFYRLFPNRSTPLPPPPLFLAPGPPPVDSLPPQGPAPSGVSQVDPLPGTVPVEVTVDSGAASGGVEPGGAESEGAESRGAELGGSLSLGGPPGALSWREPLSPSQLREWFVRRTRLQSGAARAGGSAAGGNGAAGAGGAAGVGAGGTGAGATGAANPGGARTGGTGAAGASGAAGVGSGGAGAGAAGGSGAGAAGGTRAAGPGGARAGGTRAAGAGGAAGVGAGDTGAEGAGPGGAGAPTSPLPAPSPYTEQTGGLTERREPVSCPASRVCAVRTGRRVPRQRPPPVPGTHPMALRPSSVPQRVPLPSPHVSSLADGSDPESDLVCAASPAVPRLLATVVTGPSFESAAASALVADLVDFAAACRLDYATSLVAESESDCPPSVGGEHALSTDVLEDSQEEFECLSAAVPHLVAMMLAPKGDPDAPDIRTPRSYAEAITGPYSSH